MSSTTTVPAPVVTPAAPSTKDVSGLTVVACIIALILWMTFFIYGCICAHRYHTRHPGSGTIWSGAVMGLVIPVVPSLGCIIAEQIDPSVKH